MNSLKFLFQNFEKNFKFLKFREILSFSKFSKIDRQFCGVINHNITTNSSLIDALSYIVGMWKDVNI